MKTMNEKYGDGSDHDVCNGCGMCLTCGDCMCEVEEFICSHCGSKDGTWLDRSTSVDGHGNLLEYEDFPTRCNEFGKNNDELSGPALEEGGMRRSEALLCVDCDRLSTHREAKQDCPYCGSTERYSISRWLPPIILSKAAEKYIDAVEKYSRGAAIGAIL